MRTRATFLTGVAVGYVLGARAGRQRYEQIARQARRAWENPKVQQTVGDVQEKATQTAATKGRELQDKLTHTVQDLASTAKDKAQETVSSVRHHGDSTDEVVLTTYDSTTGSMETTTVDISDGAAGSNGRPG